MIQSIAVNGMLGFYSEVWDVHDYLIISICVISKQTSSERAKRRAVLDQWWWLVAYESRPMVTSALEVWGPSSAMLYYCFHRSWRHVETKEYTGTSLFSLRNLEYPEAVALRWVIVRRNTASGGEGCPDLGSALFFTCQKHTPCCWLTGLPGVTLWEVALDVRTWQRLWVIVTILQAWIFFKRLFHVVSVIKANCDLMINMQLHEITYIRNNGCSSSWMIHRWWVICVWKSEVP